MKNLVTFASKTICHACIVTVRCLLGPVYCSFPEGCTTYALKQLREEPLARALKNIAKRLLACTFPRTLRYCCFATTQGERGGKTFTSQAFLAWLCFFPRASGLFPRL